MFVRWLGAYGRCDDALASATWELTQTRREVAAEPLLFGRSLLLAEQHQVFVGLVACETASEFRGGFFADCWSSHDKDGLLRSQKSRPVRDLSRFRAAWNKSRPRHHGEAFFDFFAARAVAVRAGATNRQLRIAQDIARKLDLIIVTVEEHVMSP